MSYGNGTEELYVQPLNTLNIRTGVSENSPRASMAEGSLGTEPVRQIRSMLEAGRLRDAGTGTVDGHAVQRLVGEVPERAGTPPWPVEYDVSPGTYVPVRFTIEEIGQSTPGNTGTLTAVVDVNTYEVLPLNGTTAPLLSVHPTGNPTVHRDQSTNAQSARHKPRRPPGRG